MPKPPIQVWIILVPTLLIAAFSVLLPLFAKTGELPPDEKWSGLFYSNRDDPALLVPKRYGIGYTLNFGNPWSWVVLVLIFVMSVLPFGFSVGKVRHWAK